MMRYIRSRSYQTFFFVKWRFFLHFSLLSLSVCSIRKYCLYFQMAKLNSENWKNEEIKVWWDWLMYYFWLILVETFIAVFLGRWLLFRADFQESKTVLTPSLLLFNTNLPTGFWLVHFNGTREAFQNFDNFELKIFPSSTVKKLKFNIHV